MAVHHDPLGGQLTLSVVGVQQRRIDAVGQQGGQFSFPAQIRGVLQAHSLGIVGPAARGCCAGPAKTETSERDAWYSPGVLAQPTWCSADVDRFSAERPGRSLLLRHRGLMVDCADSRLHTGRLAIPALNRALG